MPELTPFLPRGSKGFLAYARHKLQSEINFKRAMGLYGSGRNLFLEKKRVLDTLASSLGVELDDESRRKCFFLVGVSDSMLSQKSIAYGIQHAREFKNIGPQDKIAAALFIARAHKSATEIYHARHFLESLEDAMAELKIRRSSGAEEIHDAAADARLGMLCNSFEVRPLAPKEVDEVTRRAFGGYYHPDEMALGEILASRYAKSGVSRSDYLRRYLRKKLSERGYGIPHVSITGDTAGNLKSALGFRRKSKKDARQAAFEDFMNVTGFKAPKTFNQIALADFNLSHEAIRKAVDALHGMRRSGADRIAMVLSAARFYDAAVGIYGRRDTAERVLDEFRANKDYPPKKVQDKLEEYRLRMLSDALRPLLEKEPEELEKKQAALLHAYNKAKENHRDPNTMALVELKVKSILDQARIEVALQANPKANETQLLLSPSKAMFNAVKTLHPSELEDAMKELEEKRSAASVINRELLFSESAISEKPSHVIRRVARLVPASIR